jgi:hypothetical protein
MDWVMRLDCGGRRERRNKKITSTTAIVNNENAITINENCVVADGTIFATGGFCLGTDAGGGFWSCGGKLAGDAWIGGVSLSGAATGDIDVESLAVTFAGGAWGMGVSLAGIGFC